MTLGGRLVGSIDESGDYVISQGGRELKRIRAKDVASNQKLASAVRRNGWEQPEGQQQ